MEVAIRGINLMLASSLVADRLSPQTRERIASSLVDHYRFLRRFPEISDVPGNHYLADLLGEAVLSVVAGVPGAFRAHLQAFAEEADRQFEEEGCHIERAPVYHRLCADMVALAAAFAVREIGAALDPLLRVLERAIRFSRAVADTRGYLPVLGDCDSGQILEFGAPARDIAALLALTRCADTTPSSDQAIWLEAICGRGRNLRVPAHVVEAAESRSGFLSGRCGSATVAMRVGAQGLAGRAAHDHDDAQSFWLSCDGRDLLVDRGCHSYTLDPEIRKTDLVSRSHNVLQPLDSDRFQGRPGSIGLSMRGAPTCAVAGVCLIDGAVQLKASIDRAGPLSDVTRTLRLAVAGDGYDLRVIDTWSSPAESELRWHFGPGIEPQVAGRHMVVFGTESPIRSLVVESEALLRIEWFNFDFSPIYGQKLPCFGVRALLSATAASDQSRLGRVETRFAFG